LIFTTEDTENTKKLREGDRMPENISCARLTRFVSSVLSVV